MGTIYLQTSRGGRERLQSWTVPAHLVNMERKKIWRERVDLSTLVVHFMLLFNKRQNVILTQSCLKQSGKRTATCLLWDVYSQHVVFAMSDMGRLCMHCTS